MKLSHIRLARICVVTLLIALFAASCGPEAPTPTPVQPAATTAPAEPTAASSGGSSDSGTLAVLDWAGYDAEDFWTDFKKMYPNVTVNFEIGSSDADVYGKMKGGNQADTFHSYTGWLNFFVDEGLAEEIDTSKLSNWDK